MALTILLSVLIALSAGTKKLAAVGIGAFVCLFLWHILVSNGQKSLPFFRKLLLGIFSLLFVAPYLKMSTALTDVLVNRLDLNYLLGQYLYEFKGTDWADGLLSATFFFLYIGFIGYLWALEKKASKPPPDKPLKIEARIGNIKD
jgi:phosphotransferase system  glucose/maltose/N-acetylglucosamine-specific IIC component